MRKQLWIFASSSIMSLNFLSSCTGCDSGDDMPFKKSTVHREVNISPEPTPPPPSSVSNGETTVVQMTKEGGFIRYQFALMVLKWTSFLTLGASTISISNLEATYLMKQGKITKEDVTGSSEFVDALGNVSEGTILNLREVSIGGRSVYNVRASVVDNNSAPLLLGQSFLEQFGRISIDYKEGTLTFF